MSDLKVKSVSGAMVQDYNAMRAGLRRFVGYRFVTQEMDGVVRQAFERTDDVVSLPYRGEYLGALREGSLEPADEYTAKLAGRPLAKSSKSKE